MCMYVYIYTQTYALAHRQDHREQRNRNEGNTASTLNPKHPFPKP